MPTTGSDVVLSLLGVLAVASLVLAMVTWARSRDRSIISLGWFFGILALPILGPVGYLLDNRRRTRRDQDDAALEA